MGGNEGFADRAIVADVFFSQTEPGVTPTFATKDAGIYNNMLLITGRSPRELGKPVAEAFAAGFEVTINGRTIKVVPLPRR